MRLQTAMNRLSVVRLNFFHSLLSRFRALHCSPRRPLVLFTSVCVLLTSVCLSCRSPLSLYSGAALRRVKLRYLHSNSFDIQYSATVRQNEKMSTRHTNVNVTDSTLRCLHLLHTCFVHFVFTNCAGEGRAEFLYKCFVCIEFDGKDNALSFHLFPLKKRCM